MTIMSKTARRTRNYARLLNPTERTLVLSDVDGTLVRGSLLLDHALMLDESGEIDLGPLADQWRADPKNEQIIRTMAESYREQIVGRRIGELRVPQFIDGLLADEANLYSTVERLKEHRAAGHRVVLISGSPGYLLRPFARRFGFEAIGSLYHMTRTRELTGRITGMFGAPQKSAVVSSMDLSGYSKVIGYGDTASDAPLLAVSDYSVLVDPNPLTMKSLGDLRISEIVRG